MSPVLAEVTQIDLRGRPLSAETCAVLPQRFDPRAPFYLVPE